MAHLSIIAKETEVQVVETTTDVHIVLTEKQVDIVEVGNVIQVHGDGAVWVTGEIPTGLVNGANATFTTAFDFVPESVEVFLETCRLGLLDDYNTSGNRTITFYVSPLLGEKIKVNYQKL